MIKKNNNITLSLLFTIITLIYLLFRNKTAGWGDSLPILLCSLEGFSWSVNATGHFLYVNFKAMIVKLLYFIDPLNLLTLTSIIFSVFCLVSIYKIVKILTKNKTAASFSVVTIGLSFTYWRQAEVIEVYSFYNFIIVTVIYYVLQDLIKDEFNNPYKVSLWMGLAVVTHIQTVLLLPFYFIYLLHGKEDKVKKSIYSFLLFSVITSVLFFPVIFLSNYILSSIFFDFRFKSAVLNYDISTIIKGLIKSVFFALYNFHFFLLFICHGIILCYKKSKKLFIIFSFIILPIWFFAMRYTISDNYVFFLIPYIVLAIISGYAYMFWTEKMLNRKIMVIILFSSILLSPVLYYVTLKISYSIPQLENFDTRTKYKGGLKYYLWPGMENGVDPLELAVEQYKTSVPPENVNEIEWKKNYPIAIEYLKHKGEIK